MDTLQLDSISSQLLQCANAMKAWVAHYDASIHPPINIPQLRMLREQSVVDPIIQSLETSLLCVETVQAASLDIQSQLRLQLNRARSLLTPIHVLPHEMLAHIFTYGISAATCDMAEMTKAQSLVLSISHVCRRWRHIALQQSTLWAFTDIFWSLRRRETWQLRSASRPQSVIANLTNRHPMIRLPGGLDIDWRSLYIKLGPEDDARLQYMFTHVFPNLESLHISLLGSFTSRIDLRGSTFPQLRTLHLDGRLSASLDQIGPHLSSLTLDAINFSELRLMLRSCTALKHLDVGFSLSQVFIYPANTTVMFPPTIETLTMRSMNKRSLEMVLRHFRPFNLRSLKFEVSPGLARWSAEQEKLWAELIQPFFQECTHLEGLSMRAESDFISLCLRCLVHDIGPSNNAGPRVVFPSTPISRLTYIDLQTYSFAAASGISTTLAPYQTIKTPVEDVLRAREQYLSPSVGRRALEYLGVTEANDEETIWLMGMVSRLIVYRS